jgi:hypothetical protein
MHLAIQLLKNRTQLYHQYVKFAYDYKKSLKFIETMAENRYVSEIL